MLILPTDFDGKNADRAASAGAAITEFIKRTGIDAEDSLSVLLTNLMHWADRADFDFEAAYMRGRDNYLAETGWFRNGT